MLRGEETTTRAIVFCTTREGVAEMHAALVARGFAATAISGDRAQAERDRALEQLRRGDAQVLVATNVAARGLHLPDVDLIVHADLPLNADSLIHRSGRTGRAGRKGTAVVIATAFERRKAERLLGAAQVKVEWTPPPSAETIAAAARARLADELVAGEPAAEEPAAEATAAADDLLARVEDKLPARELLRRLLARELARMPIGEPVRPVNIAGPASGNRGGGYQDLGPPGRKGSHRDFAREGVAFRVNLGANDRADPRWLLPLICRRGGVTRREVGAIRIGPNETMFEIAGGAARDFALAASEPDPRARHIVITRADAPNARSEAPPSERAALPSHAPEPHPRSHPPRAHQPPRAPEPPRPHQPARAPGAPAAASAPARARACRGRTSPARAGAAAAAPAAARAGAAAAAPARARAGAPAAAPARRGAPEPPPSQGPRRAAITRSSAVCLAKMRPSSRDRTSNRGPTSTHARTRRGSHTSARSNRPAQPAGTGRRRDDRRSRHTRAPISRRTRARISRRGRTRRASRASTAARAERRARQLSPFSSGVTSRRTDLSRVLHPRPAGRRHARANPWRPARSEARDWNRSGRPRRSIHPSIEPRSRRTAVDANRTSPDASSSFGARRGRPLAFLAASGARVRGTGRSRPIPFEQERGSRPARRESQARGPRRCEHRRSGERSAAEGQPGEGNGAAIRRGPSLPSPRSRGEGKSLNVSERRERQPGGAYAACRRSSIAGWARTRKMTPSSS